MVEYIRSSRMFDGLGIYGQFVAAYGMFIVYEEDYSRLST